MLAYYVLWFHMQWMWIHYASGWNPQRSKVICNIRICNTCMHIRIRIQFVYVYNARCKYKCFLLINPQSPHCSSNVRTVHCSSQVCRHVWYEPTGWLGVDGIQIFVNRSTIPPLQFEYSNIPLFVASMQACVMWANRLVGCWWDSNFGNISVRICSTSRVGMCDVTKLSTRTSVWHGHLDDTSWLRGYITNLPRCLVPHENIDRTCA